MQAARLLARLQREITMLKTDPPPGVCAWPHNDLLTHLEAQIQGPANTVYSRGLFKLDVQVPERYPFEPPCVRFVTPIYHPNIDSGGRICLDILNMPPKGAWKPSLNIPTVLTSIGLLLSDPNPDDGLMGDITAEYKHHRSTFDQKARKMTEQYALPSMQFDTGHQGKISTSSVVQVSSPMPSANRKSDMKLPADVHPAQDNEAVSSSCKSNGDEVATATAHRQRLALGKKLSLTKPEPLPAVVHAKQQLCGPSRVQEKDEQLSAADLLKVMEQRPEDGVELDSEKTSAGCTTTKQVQNTHPSLPRPGLLGKAVSEEPPKPSRLSLLSRLKTSRPRLQKPTLSSGQSSTSTNQEAACTVVSDSESDSEEVPPLRSRLSLTQRAYAGKRKASLLR